jgi:hypothetical protein
MSALARPGVLAGMLAGSGLALHPAFGASRWLTGQPAVLAALLVLAALGLLARAVASRGRRADDTLVAAGAVVLLVALGVDGLRGHHGTLTLVAGQTRPHFDETGPDGRSLGLRPLGFAIGAEGVLASGAVALALPGREAPVELTPEGSVAFGGYRFARPRASATGGASRLRVAASDGARTEITDLAPGVPARAFGLTIALEEYFPDFALDERQQPFSRSLEPRNPAALLAVEKGGQSYRAFVLKSMPGVHRIEPLRLAFSLIEIEPERQAEIAVHREPGALGALLGAVLLALGVALSLRSVPTPVPRGGSDVLALLAGGALVLLLAFVDRGAVLAWDFSLPGAGGRVPLAGVGVLLGVALILALGGALLLAAQLLAGDGAGSRPTARGALWLAVGAAGAGLVPALVRLADLPGGPTLAAGRPLAGIALAAALLAASLLASRTSRSPLLSRAVPLALPVATIAAIVLAVASGVAGVRRDGTYATPAAAAAAAAALLGLGTLEPTGARGLRGLGFLLALLALAIL